MDCIGIDSVAGVLLYQRVRRSDMYNCELQLNGKILALGHTYIQTETQTHTNPKELKQNLKALNRWHTVWKIITEPFTFNLKTIRMNFSNWFTELDFYSVFCLFYVASFISFKKKCFVYQCAHFSRLTFNFKLHFHLCDEARCRLLFVIIIELPFERVRKMAHFSILYYRNSNISFLRSRSQKEQVG